MANGGIYMMGSMTAAAAHASARAELICVVAVMRNLSDISPRTRPARGYCTVVCVLCATGMPLAQVSDTTRTQHPRHPERIPPRLGASLASMWLLIGPLFEICSCVCGTAEFFSLSDSHITYFLFSRLSSPSAPVRFLLSCLFRLR
jgi:hypothetical protein